MMNQARESSTLARRIVHRFAIAIVFLAGVLLFLYLPTWLRFFDKEQSLTVYMFTEFVSQDAVRAFEKEYGIKVYLQYFETNEELRAKFKINEGVGYDVITPSDYMIELLRRDGLLHEIDATKLAHFGELDKRLLNRYFDPENRYSVPITWSAYGIVYDKKILKNPLQSVHLSYLFQNPLALVEQGVVKRPYKICMFDDSQEVFLLASLYLYNKNRGITDEQLEEIEQLLIRQKKWVESYTNFGLDYFLEGNIISFAMISSRYVKRIFETRNDRFAFQIPQQGCLAVIENFAIPKQSAKVDAAHKFIDFMLSRKYNTHHFFEYGGTPVNKCSYQDIPEKYLQAFPFIMNDEVFEKLHLIHNELPLKKVEELWLRVKTS